MGLQRINDSTYVLLTKENKTISINVSSKVKDTSFKYYLAEKAAKVILEEKNSKNFRLGNKKWKVRPLNRSLLHLFFAKIFPFIHKPSDHGILRYDVKSSFFGKGRVKKPKTPEKATLKKVLKRGVDRANYRHYLLENNKAHSAKRLEEFRNKIRGKEPFKEGVLDFKQPFFEDPFTKLSSKAFQIYEKEYTSKDYFAPEFCDYRLIKRNNKILLVHKKSPLVDKENSQAAIKVYKDFITKHFGREKVKYIQHLYRFNLDTIDTLTPEHIYRMNIGLNNLEYQDLETFYLKLKKIDENLAGQDLNLSLEDYLRNSKELTRQEARGLFRFLNKEKPATLIDLKAWIDSLKPFGENSAALNPQTINNFIEILSFNDRERDLSLTGRPIFRFIRSGYTTAGFEEYKPWVDQHQLTQIYSELVNSPNEEAYQELLSHVVVKIHLAKEHPTEGFRVGGLIPAPPVVKNGVKGPIRWYKVTSCVSNGYGIFNFTLESAGNDPSLPSIVLYRSTARCSYALHSRASLINDLNNFNSPGHQGIGRTDPYENEFFKRRTWPAWMGYNYLAEQKLQERGDLKGVSELLVKANEALLNETENKYRRKTFEEILKAYDTVLNDLLFDFLFAKKKKTHFFALLKYIIKTYIITPANQILIHRSVQIDPVKEKADAVKLKKELLKILKDERTPRLRNEIELAIKEIETFILTDQYKQKAAAAREEFNRSIYNSLEKSKKQAEEQLKKGHFENAKTVLKKWVDKINNYGQKMGESLETKTQTDLYFSGHSLGGACAQSHLVHWTADRGRIPLPGKKCVAYCFDDPAINLSYNRLFKDFGNKHVELLNSLKINFGVVRRQESDDFAVTAGEEHFGAADDLAEQNLLNRWFFFNAAVLKKSRHSEHAPIAFPRTVHETRFLSGKKKNTFYKRSDLLTLKREWENKTDSPHQKEALEQINKALNQPKDYLMTYYTNHIQKIFDTQGACCSKNHLPNEKIFDDINQRIWHIPSVFKPRYSEEMRKSVSFFFMYIRKLATSTHDNYPLDENFIDQRGNFVVGMQGVLTKRKNLGVSAA